MKIFGKVEFTLNQQKLAASEHGSQVNAEAKIKTTNGKMYHVAPEFIRFMKRCSLCLLLLVIACTFSSCYSTYQVSCANDYWNRFKGSTKNEIIREWGVPTRIEGIGDGESVLVYEKFVSNTRTHNQSETKYEIKSSSNVQAKTYGNSNSTTSEDRYFTEFYMNENGYCYMVKTTDTKTSSDKKFDGGKTTGLIMGVVIPAILLVICIIGIQLTGV